MGISGPYEICPNFGAKRYFQREMDQKGSD